MSEITLTSQEFLIVQKLIFNEIGINLGESKKMMIQARLFKRLKHYQLNNYNEYLKIVQISRAEKLNMLNQITTNETYFFREEVHFDFLSKVVQKQKEIRVWSAASSLGAEAYSIAMVLDNILGLKWEVVGSDINTDVLQKAKEGLYPFSWVKKIPTVYQKKYCLKGRGSYEGKFLVDRTLMKNMTFKENNLMQINKNLGKFDIIFLRNVLLYFNEKTKLDVIKNVMPNLKSGGYLIISLTENFEDKKIDELRYIDSSIFQKVI